MQKVGSFHVRSGSINVGDPCYGGDTVLPAKNGEWVAHVEMSDEGSWGMRVARLVAHHKDHPHGRRDLGNSVGVDSGQMSISDVEIAPALGEGLYDEVCNSTLKGHAGIVAAGTGVASSSGFGDGGYALLLAKEGDLVVGAEVVFIHKQECTSCGTVFEPREDDICLCDDCYAEENSEYCSECGNLTPEDEMRDDMCEDCYDEWHRTHTCDICGCAVEDESDLTDGQCEHCYAEHKISG